MPIGASWASGSWQSTPESWATGTWAGGADIPANLDPETAIVIGALPYATTQTVHSADTGLTYSVYYRYTPTENGVLSIFVYGDISLVGYAPTVAVRTYDAPSGTYPYYNNMFNYSARPVYFEVAAGTTFYFQIVTNVGNPSPAVLTLSLQAWPGNATVPTGSLFINDDTVGWPAAIISSATGEPLSYISTNYSGSGFPSSEVMAQLDDGTFATLDSAETDLKIFNGSYALIAAVARYDGLSFLSSNRTDRFYVGQGASGTTPGLVEAITSAGAVAASWTVTPSPLAYAPRRDDTILYYGSGVTGTPVYRWDLTNDVALSDLAAGVANHRIYEMFVLGDNTILALYRESPLTPTSALFVRRYSAAGATLNTYTFPTAKLDGDFHLAIDTSDPDAFWAWEKVAAIPSPSKFSRIRTSDGTVLSSVQQYPFLAGEYRGPVSTTPDAYFGHSVSCTFLITALAPTPPPAPGTGRSLTIRRLRRAPHLSREQLWNFYHLLQLDLETGVGLSSGQGSDPQIMLRWSDDGGHTWSNEYWVSAGRQGQYKARAMFRRLGRSRDRIFEVVVSDPVRWNLIAAYLDVTAGES